MSNAQYYLDGWTHGARSFWSHVRNNGRDVAAMDAKAYTVNISYRAAGSFWRGFRDAWRSSGA